MTPDSSACCESLCFDFSYAELDDEGCYSILITLDAMDGCFPEGLRYKGGHLTYLGDNGELSSGTIVDEGVYYEYCQDNPFPSTEYFSAEGRVFGCDLVFAFDLFGEGPFERQCPPVID